MLPKNIDNEYIFPNVGEKNINFQLKLRNSTAPNWGLTTTWANDVTIRDTDNLTVTFSITDSWQNATIALDNLKVGRYQDQTWDLQGSKLRLVNVKTNKWSPIVHGNNTLKITNSQLADNAFSSGRSKVIIENSTAQFLHAVDSVEMTVKDSRIEGDVVAKDNGKITLINTAVGGQKKTEDRGKIVE